MSHSIICDRAFEFAIRVVKLCERLAARGFGARHIATQLIRCGTSIGANAEEAQEGQTKADYIAKMSISSKESRESGYWLRLAWPELQFGQRDRHPIGVITKRPSALDQSATKPASIFR